MQNKTESITYDATFKVVATTIIDAYKKFHVQEYKDFLVAMKPKQTLLKENTWGKIGGKQVMEFIEEPLVEYPVTLFNLLRNQLSEVEMKWFQSKDGAKWFGRAYPEFKLWRGK